MNNNINNIVNINENIDSETNKKLLSDFKINFENINKINIIIAEELEKRFSLAEESTKILFNQIQNIDFSFLINLICNEKSKISFTNIKKHLLDENIFLCEYVFKSINFGSLFLAYLIYVSKNCEITENYRKLIESSEFTDGEEINLNIKLNEKFPVNNLLQYISLFDFKILLFYYDGVKNSADISLEIKDKINILIVFIDLLKYYGITEISIK